MQTHLVKPLAALPLALLLGACAAAPIAPTQRSDLQARADATLQRLVEESPALGSYHLPRAHAYAVFPEVAKGAYLVGGSFGRGVVYRGGVAIGTAELVGASFGLQVGGQSFSELIVFEDEAALRRFTDAGVSATLEVSAVMLTTGAAVSARYVDGVMVFARPLGGAMVEAALGGQRFTFQPG